MEIAHQTLAAIAQALINDGGNAYRKALSAQMKATCDAFDNTADEPRSYLGASVIGRDCARELWYSFRWAVQTKLPPKLILLFNRGHLEEARFLALLTIIGCELWAKDEEGKQYGAILLGGHFRGSADCVIRGLPEYPDETILGEFKTHNDRSFNQVTSEGVESAHWAHFVQMQIYMGFLGLNKALYLAVNKNDESLHGEFVEYRKEVFEQYTERARKIIQADSPPPKINESPGWYKCRFCPSKEICHGEEVAQRTCRTCVKATVSIDSEGWFCKKYKKHLTKEEQAAACDSYTRSFL